MTCGKGGKRRRRRHLELTEQARQELPDYVQTLGDMCATSCNLPRNVVAKFESLRAHAEALWAIQSALAFD